MIFKIFKQLLFIFSLSFLLFGLLVRYHLQAGDDFGVDFDWDTEDELEIENIPLASHASLTFPGVEANLVAGEVNVMSTFVVMFVRVVSFHA